MAPLCLILTSLFLGSSFAAAEKNMNQSTAVDVSPSVGVILSSPQDGEIDLVVLENNVAVFEDPGKSNSEKLEAVTGILVLLEKSPGFQFKHYWNSVFQTFQCELKDKGRMIPFCIIKHLDSIKEGLFFAHQKYPEHYHYAPARTLAIMYFKMPGIVGGSEKKSKKFIQEAFEGDPDFKENRKWYLQITGTN